jgi:hypothetical protein
MIFAMASSKTPLRNTRLAVLIFALFSVLAFGYMVLMQWQWLRQTESAQATLVGWKPQRYAFLPIWEYQPTEADTVIQFTSNVPTTDTLHPTRGQQQWIRYRPEQPTQAVVYDFWHLWFAPSMVLVFGLMPLALVCLIRYILMAKINPDEDLESPLP